MKAILTLVDGKTEELNIDIKDAKDVHLPDMAELSLYDSNDNVVGTLVRLGGKTFGDFCGLTDLIG